MYKDVKKKLLSVVLCVCMIIGMVQVVPRAKADASLTGEYYPIKVSTKGAAGEETVYVKLANNNATIFDYRNEAYIPQIEKVVKDTINPDSSDITGEFKTELKVLDGSDNVNSGDFYCSLVPASGSNYDVNYEKSENQIKFTIRPVEIYDILVDTGLTEAPVLKYSVDGISPVLKSVKVVLNNDARTKVTLSSGQYEAAKIFTAGRDKISQVTIKDTANNFTNEDLKTKDVICDVAYDLAAGFVTLNTPTITYTGQDLRQSVAMTLYNDQGNPVSTSVTMNTNGLKVTFKQNGSTVTEVKSAGDYTVEVTPSEGENAATLVSAALYTGKYVGNFTVGRKSADSFKVTAWDSDLGKKVELSDDTSAYLYRLPLSKKNSSGEVLPEEMVVEVDGKELTANQYTISFEGDTRPTKAGQYTMYIVPSTTTNYTGRKVVKYYVYSELAVELIRFSTYKSNETLLYYTGTGHQLEELDVKDSSGNLLTKDVHYEVKYQYYDNGWKEASSDTATGMETVGKKRVVVVGKNAYRGEEVTQEYEIARVDMSNPTYKQNFALTIDTSKIYYYTGEEITPNFTFKYYGTDVSTDHYDVAWKNNIEAGIATLTVTAKDTSPYAGSMSANFEIEALQLSSADFVGDGISLTASEYSYTGKPLTPKFKIGSYILKDSDFKAVKYVDRATGNTLASAPINTGIYEITLESTNASIRGSAITRNYEIIKRDISTDTGASFILKVNGDGTLEWNGGATEPEVICGSMSMTEGTDYTVTYENNTAPGASGAAIAKITGSGNFTGTKEIHFTIMPRRISNVNVVVTPNVSGSLPASNYNVSLSVQDTGVDVIKANLSKGTDYTITSVTYETEDDYTGLSEGSLSSLERAGKYRVTLEGKDKYTDTVDIIVECGTNIENATIKLGEGIYTYNGDEQYPTITVSMNGKTASFSKGDALDTSPFKPTFERSEADSVPVGQENIYAGTVYVKATGNTKQGYYGTTVNKASYSIGKLDIKTSKTRYEIDLTHDADILRIDTEGKVHYKFLNEKIVPDEIVQKASTNTATSAPDPLVEGRDYTVRYGDDCISVGSHWLYVEGKGNFTGEIGCSFYIDAMSIDNNQEIDATFENVDTYAEGVPTLVLTQGGSHRLVEGTDYQVNVEREKSSSSVDWNDTYVYKITGMGNFAGTTRVEKCPITKTTLKKAADLENPQATEVYISSWDINELMVSSGASLTAPSKFTLTYVRKNDTNGATYKLVNGTDFTVEKFVTSGQPGTQSSMVIKGKGGFDGEISFDVTLYTDINDAEFLRDDNGDYASVLYNGASISVSELENAIKENKLADLVTFEKVWSDEANGVVDPINYTVTLPNGYVPHIGSLTLTIAGTQKEPKYYAGSRKITVTVTGALDGSLVTAVIGDNNNVAYSGTDATPGNTKFCVYDDKRLLKGVDESAYLADPDRDTNYADYDYVISFTDNTTIGLAQAIIRGINNYSGTLTQPFKITYPFSKLTAQVLNDEGNWVTYEGGLSYDYNIETDLNKPSVRLYYTAEGTLTDSDDWMRIDESLYKVTYDGYDRAGDAKIIITGPDEIAYKDILTGNGKTMSYKLTTIPIVGTGSAVQLTMNRTPMYSGNSITATDLELLLTYKGYELVEGVDYRVQYYNNINASTNEVKGSVVINGMGNFSGSRSESFQVLTMPIGSQSDISVSVLDVIYTGSPEKPVLTLRQERGNPRTLLEDSDYEVQEYWDGASIHQQTPFTAVGSYYVVVKGKGNYSGTREIPYRIVERSMTDGVEISFENSERCPIIDGVPSCAFDGKPHEPAVHVVYNGIVLKGPNQTATPDYTLNYANNINAGAATITITGTGSFNGTKTMEFRIQPRDIAGEDFIYLDENDNVFVDEVNYAFTGNPVEPSIKVVDHGMPGTPELVRYTDYEVTYTDDNDDMNEHRYAGEVTLTVSGTGNYGGTKEFTYYIGDDISQAYTLINGHRSASTEYNGLVQAPDANSITVVGGSASDLIDANGEKRYDIAYYKDNFAKGSQVTTSAIVDAGTYYVAVVGVPSKGTYAKSSESNSSKYIINPRSIAPSYILVSGYEGTYYYTGQEICPKGIAVEDTDLPVSSSENDPQRRTVKLTNGIDYELKYMNNISAGKASIVVSGKGNYTGSRVAYFNIISSNADGNNTWDGSSEGTGSISNGSTTIAASDIQLGYDNSTYECMMYNGYERIPTVNISGISNSEFIITASNNIRPGVATLTITGRGNNFTGTIIKNYKIKADLSTYGRISAIEDQVYTGYQITPHVTLTCGGNILNQGSDYTVSYMNNTSVGKATVMATATNDSYYIGTATGSFNISNTAGGMEITGYASSYIYTGYAITPDVVVTMNGRVLSRGTDYTVTYSNNTNVGTATMTINGIGSFSGTKTINYTIEAKNIENCLTTAVTNYQYTGNTYTPNVTVTDSSTGKTLVAGTDYTITYSNNTNPGTASITVTALSNNYTGSKVIPFKITSAAVSGLRTSTIKNNSIKLAWSAQDYADGYQICNSSNRVVATTSKNSYTVKGLTSCTTYKFKVRSYVENADGSVSYGDFSTAVSAKTLLNTPTLKVKSTSKGKVTLTWTKVSKATGYEIYYSTKKDGIYTRLKTISKSSSRKYVDSGLASGEKYYYTIRAYRTANGVKTYSNYNTIKSVKVK